MVEAYPSPGEINRKISDPAAAIQRVLAHYQSSALTIDKTDGISMEFDQWRFNLRMSNTEPVVRLNIETRGDKQLLAERQAELLELLESA
jgi:phosphomannomutase